MESILKYGTFTNVKWTKVSTLVVLMLCIIFLIPQVILCADELGGYISEKLIGSGAISNSELVIGLVGSDNSELDIADSQEGIPRTHMNFQEPAFQLNYLIPLIFMSMFIILLLNFLVNNDEVGMSAIIIIAVIIYLFYALLGGINIQINNLLGG